MHQNRSEEIYNGTTLGQPRRQGKSADRRKTNHVGIVIRSLNKKLEVQETVSGNSTMSDGYRPGRSAHQAVKEVHKYLNFGCRWVIDLDIKQCFDTIPHEELIALFRERITDKWIIRLIRRWLKAKILDGSQIQYTEIGTVQGSVLSPILANLYLNQLDKMWAERNYVNRYRENAHLIRFADDIAVLCPKKEIAEKLFKEIEATLAKMKLKLNKEKSKVVDIKDGDDFLGFHFTSGYSYRKKKEVMIKFPSAKAVKSIRRNVKEQLKASPLGGNLKEVTKGVNIKLRGWGNYFLIGNSSRQFSDVNHYVTEQLRLFLRRRYGRKSVRGYRNFTDRYFYKNLGLMNLSKMISLPLFSNAG